MVALVLFSTFSAVFCLVTTSPQSNSDRCLVLEPTQKKLHPPLVLIGGMAQSFRSWDHQLPYLSKNRKVIVYECLGQGRNGSILNLENVSLPAQATTLVETLDDLSLEQVDLVGFSFGGRVAMATGCLHPKRLRKLHLTGVAADRSDYGHLAMEAWQDIIQSDRSLRSFAWSILMATYSPNFLRNQPIERYLEHICQSNAAEGLLSLFEQAEVNNPDDPWHVVNMARQINEWGIPGKLCVGDLDLMAPPNHAKELCQILGWPSPEIVSNCGHAVGLEAARARRTDVLSFLDEP